MSKKIEELLPIGTIVKLKGSKKRVMIHGIMVQIDNMVYEYAAVLYPEGFLGTGSQIAFQSEDIEKVYFVGFIDAERQQFIAEQVIVRDSKK